MTSLSVYDTADICICNNSNFMTLFYNKPIQTKGSILDDMFPGQRKIQLNLSQKDKTKGVILNFKNVFFLLSSLCNLISLTLLNNHKIFYNHKNKTLYDLETKEMLAQVK